MKRKTFQQLSSLAIGCISGAALLAAGTSPAAWGGNIITRMNIPMADFGRATVSITDPDYDAECADKQPQTHYGPLLLEGPIDFEDHRCVRVVYGNLTIDVDNSTRGLVLPWLRQVVGDLELEGNPNLPAARLPRLNWVSGEIVVDAWYGGGTRWEARSLERHAGRFTVEAGSLTDLRGFDDLEDIGTLDLWLRPVNPPMNQQMPVFRGLSGLATVGRLEIDTHAEQALQTADFLESLVEVRGTADIWTRYWLIGTDAIETVGGNLDIEVKNTYGGATTDGLDSLREVGGRFSWDDTNLYDIAALANLESVGGDLELPLDVTSLAGFASLHTVGGDFTLEGPVDVPNLQSLSSLAFVGGQLAIERSGIQSLDGLQGVTHLGSLRIYDNDQLSSVAALGNATIDPYSTVAITYNSPLTDCQANNLVSSMVVPGTTPTTVTGNVTPCTSLQQLSPVLLEQFRIRSSTILVGR